MAILRRFNNLTCSQYVGSGTAKICLIMLKRLLFIQLENCQQCIHLRFNRKIIFCRKTVLSTISLKKLTVVCWASYFNINVTKSTKYFMFQKHTARKHQKKKKSNNKRQTFSEILLEKVDFLFPCFKFSDKKERWNWSRKKMFCSSP